MMLGAILTVVKTENDGGAIFSWWFRAALCRDPEVLDRPYVDLLGDFRRHRDCQFLALSRVDRGPVRVDESPTLPGPDDLDPSAGRRILVCLGSRTSGDEVHAATDPQRLRQAGGVEAGLGLLCGALYVEPVGYKLRRPAVDLREDRVDLVLFGELDAVFTDFQFIFMRWLSALLA